MAKTASRAFRDRLVAAGAGAWKRAFGMDGVASQYGAEAAAAVGVAAAEFITNSLGDSGENIIANPAFELVSDSGKVPDGFSVKTSSDVFGRAIKFATTTPFSGSKFIEFPDSGEDELLQTDIFPLVGTPDFANSNLQSSGGSLDIRMTAKGAVDVILKIEVFDENQVLLAGEGDPPEILDGPMLGTVAFTNWLREGGYIRPGKVNGNAKFIRIIFGRKAGGPAGILEVDNLFAKWTPPSVRARLNADSVNSGGAVAITQDLDVIVHDFNGGFTVAGPQKGFWVCREGGQYRFDGRAGFQGIVSNEEVGVCIMRALPATPTVYAEFIRGAFRETGPGTHPQWCQVNDTAIINPGERFKLGVLCTQMPTYTLIGGAEHFTNMAITRVR